MIKVREKAKEEKAELPLRQRNQKMDAIVKAIGTSDRYSFEHAQLYYQKHSPIEEFQNEQ